MKKATKKRTAKMSASKRELIAPRSISDTSGAASRKAMM
jgi:hypothetical protein